jgi:long-chain acyl-CoA synthetase
MPRETLLDFFDENINSSNIFLVYEGVYRSYSYTYTEVRDAAHCFASRLCKAGIRPQDNVVLWGENRPEWIVAFWGCLIAKAVAVPVDIQASSKFVSRIRHIVSARVVVAGSELPTHMISGAEIWKLEDLFKSIRESAEQKCKTQSEVSGNDLVEIIFTSGATAEPKGVQITHNNILANIVPVEQEVLKYLPYGRPFFPLRFLNLLPLSHMFGQAMSTFIPPMLQGTTVFVRGHNPDEIVSQVKRRRISVIVCVPKILEVLRDYLEARVPETLEKSAQPEHVLKRWWRYRKVHRLFGYKFWAFVVGAAPLERELEAFWSRLGFMVIQGYGLTETAPIVTLNHPFRTKKGSAGKPISGVDVKIADDGEILVRGQNVTRGYYNAPEETATAFQDGWFHTGDIGNLDKGGTLTILGRKKEMIVTPEGLNVFPEDVENVLRKDSRVIDVAVIGNSSGGHERVHAVFILEAEADAGRVVRDANQQLEDHQRIRNYSIWTHRSLPRTEGTNKLRRQSLKKWLQGETQEPFDRNHSTPDSIDDVLARFAQGRTLTDDTTFNDLGLSSIERIELALALERVSNCSISEADIQGNSRISSLKTQLLKEIPLTPQADISTTDERIETAALFPTWSQRTIARIFRRMSLSGLLLPLTRVFAWLNVEGRHHLDTVTGPVIYAVNHQSHLDVPVILAALPSKHRYNVVIAAAREWFSAHFHPAQHNRRERFAKGLAFYLGVLLFNIVPLPQRETGTRNAMRHLGTLLGNGWSVLIFPEGRRRPTGNIATFQPGVGMLATQLRVPVIPVRIGNVDQILAEGWRMARPGRAYVSFGAPMEFSGNDYQDVALEIEKAVKTL